MADPRFFTRPCPTQYANRFAAKVGKDTTDIRNYYASINMPGDIAAANSRRSTLDRGLQSLLDASNNIKNGTGTLPTSIVGPPGSTPGIGSATANTGENWILETVGVSSTSVSAAWKIDPAQGLRTEQETNYIYQKLQAGELTAEDLEAYKRSIQDLENVANRIYTPSQQQDKLGGKCEASPYAMDLIQRHGKYQFLFVVEFIFNDGYTPLSDLTFPFVVKRSTRPNVRYQMEDINYYNFRTKVVTRTEFEEMSMSFHDDQQNQSMKFMTAYLRAQTPITNIQHNTGLLDAEEMGMDYYGGLHASGIGIGDGTRGTTYYDMFGEQQETEGIFNSYYASTIGPLLNENKTILSQVNLYHIYGFGHKMNAFYFFRPRISSFSLNELNMASGELNDVTLNFNYDSVFIETDIDLADKTYSSHIEQQRANPMYPLRYNDTATPVGASPNIGIKSPGIPTPVTTTRSTEILTTTQIFIPPAQNAPDPDPYGGIYRRDADF